MYYVYVLLCRDGDLYKGSTGNLKKRFGEHIKGQVKSTCKKLPVVLIYYQAFINKTDALREELYLKSGKGKEQLKIKLQKTLKL